MSVISSFTFKLLVNLLVLLRYFSVSIFCKIGVSGFIGGVVLGLSLFTAQLLVLLITDRVSLLVYLIESACMHNYKAYILRVG